MDSVYRLKGSLLVRLRSLLPPICTQRLKPNLLSELPKKLTAILACYLAGEVASIMSPVAAIEHREMVAPMYHPLLTPVYWVRPIYMELLHASSRLRKDTRVETARPSNGLVKILCSPKNARSRSMLPHTIKA